MEIQLQRGGGTVLEPLQAVPLRFVEACSSFIFRQGKAGEPLGRRLRVGESPFQAEWFRVYEQDMFRSGHSVSLMPLNNIMEAVQVNLVNSV